jgi:allantoinase
MMFDAAIKSNRVLTPEGFKEAVVLIRDTKILDVVSQLPEGDFELVDAGNLVLMPAIVDPHVHINEPGRTEWEGFDTATQAAIAGGIGTLIDMPLNSSPVTTTMDALKKKIDVVAPLNNKSNIHCHCGFWGGVVPGNTDEIEELAIAGVRGFKAFLTHSGIDDFPNVTESDLRKVMPVIAAHGLPLLVHCELESTKEINTGHPGSYQDYRKSRPESWEHDAIALMIKLCREFNCRTHIVHVSSAGSLELIRAAKESGIPLTAETAQHYLYFDSDMIQDGQTQFKCAPPIRDAQNREKLWKGLEDSILDFVATDHSPAPPGLKQIKSGDFQKAWGGISSLQFALPALWTAARKRKLSEEDICKWLCSESTKICGLSHQKGKIEKGFDADLIVWDPVQKFIVSSDIIYHRHKLTPYLGQELYGVVKETWLHGKKVYADGKFLHLNEGRIILNN